MRVCEHPTENYGKTHGNYNNCPECRGHVCLRCKVKDEISWSSGLCDGCFRIRERKNREQSAKWDAEAKLRGLAEAWEQGAAAIANLKPGYQVKNPYIERLEEQS